MLKKIREGASEVGLLSIACGLAIALGSFYLVESIIVNLIAPAISVFIGNSPFELNAFVIDTSEFRYGLVIEAALTLLGTVVLSLFVMRRLRVESLGPGAGLQICPECASEVPAAAKRCRYCTAPIGSV